MQSLPDRLKTALQSVFRTLAAARILLSPWLALSALLLGLVAWGSEGVGLHVIGVLVPDRELSAATALGIYSVAIVVGAISFLPGGLGSTEAVMAALLLRQGYALPEAMLLTLTCRVLTLWLAVMLGWIAMGLLRWRTRAVLS